MNNLLRPRIWPSFLASSGVGTCDVPFRYASEPTHCGCPVAQPSSSRSLRSAQSRKRVPSFVVSRQQFMKYPGLRMMSKIMKKYLVVLLLTTTISGCGELWKLVPIDPGNKPAIVDSYAPQNVKPGEVWKIFIKAEDKDGDMKDLVAKISPAGTSFFTYSITSIHEGERGEFAGYLFVKTPPSPYLRGKMFHLSVYIRDQEGRKSDPVGLLLHFNGRSEAELEMPEKWQFASRNKLGGIFSDYLLEYVREITSPRE